MADSTRETCITILEQNGLDTANATAIAEVIREYLNRLTADGKAENRQQAITDAWGTHTDTEHDEAAPCADNNALKQSTLDARISAIKAQGFTFLDAIESILVGSHKAFAGARDSIDARRVTVYKDCVGGLLHDLNALDPTIVTELLESPVFNRDVVSELIRPKSTRDAKAQQTADCFFRHMEKARCLMGAEASIGLLDGYVPLSHDPYKLLRKRADGKSPRAAWLDTITPLLDLKRTFLPERVPEGADDPLAVRRTLNELYDTLEMGKETGPNALPDNAPLMAAKHCTLHFKDADSFMQYNAAYGKGGILAGVVHHLDATSRTIALTDVLGTTPEATLHGLYQQAEAEFLAAKAGAESTSEDQAYLHTLQNDCTHNGRAGAWLAELTGEANWPVNPSFARAMGISRSAMSLSALGKASLSAVADVFVKAVNIRAHDLSWGETVAQFAERYFRIYDTEKQAIAAQAGVFMDDVVGAINTQWDCSASLPGKMADVQDTFFRWSGLNWIAESAKAGFSMWFAGHLGSVSSTAWDAVPGDIKALLLRHGFDATTWDVIRQMTQTLPNGRTLLTPQMADHLPNSAVCAYLPDELNALKQTFKNDPEALALAEANVFRRIRQTLRTDVMAMIADETQYAILGPDAATQASMAMARASGQSARPDTVAGEFWRVITQFKSFPVAYMLRQMDEKHSVRDPAYGMAAETHNVSDAITRAMPGVVGATLAAFAFGCLAAAAKDIAKGTQPRNFTQPEILCATLVESGAAGMFGDYLFHKVSLYRNAFADALAGLLADQLPEFLPKPDEAGHVLTILDAMLRGDFTHAGKDGLRQVLDSAPFVNLWYTRNMLNWALVYHIREMLSPGTLDRVARTMREASGPRTILTPAGAINSNDRFR